MFNLKPTHVPVKAYYQTLETFGKGGFDNEGQIRHAFEDLLRVCARKFDWTVVPEYQIKLKNNRTGRVDAALISSLQTKKGYWEAKDSKDDLEAEIKKKFDDGYPRTNILFQTPARAILVQNGKWAMDKDIANPEDLVDVLRQFFAYREPQVEEWEKSVKDFSARLPEIADGLFRAIEEERKRNKAFVERFAAFLELCRQSINPDLKEEAVEKMLVQHLLTERIFLHAGAGEGDLGQRGSIRAPKIVFDTRC